MSSNHFTPIMFISVILVGQIVFNLFSPFGLIVSTVNAASAVGKTFDHLSGGTFSVRCPLPHLIQPCDCVEIEKGLESEFNENDSLALSNDTVDGISSSSSSSTDGVSGDEISTLNVNSEPHPDIIETVVFCKHIYSRKQLMESMKAFKGHRINYLVIDSCSIPPFPTNIFNQINILWMEVLNSTIQFREPFFECGANCL